MKCASTWGWITVLVGLASGSIPVGAAADAGAELSSKALATQAAQMEAQCAARGQALAQSSSMNSLFDRLGGEARIHVITREMVRLHQDNPVLSDIVRRYNPDYLADILARYLITATGGPKRYEGPPLNQTHAHLRITDAQFAAGGADFAEAMKAVGASEEDIVDTACLLGGLKSQIVQK